MKTANFVTKINDRRNTALINLRNQRDQYVENLQSNNDRRVAESEHQIKRINKEIDVLESRVTTTDEAKQRRSKKYRGA